MGRSIGKDAREAKNLLNEANATLSVLDDKMKQVVTFLQSAATGMAEANWDGDPGTIARNISSVAKKVAEDIARVAAEMEEDEGDISIRDIVKFARLELDSDGDGALDMGELDDLFEKRCGIKLPIQVLNDVFNSCDEDNSGKIELKELASYVMNLVAATVDERNSYIFNVCIRSVSFWAAFSFVGGGLMGIGINLRSREVVQDWSWYWVVDSILFLYGSSVFVNLAYDSIALTYNEVETASLELKEWMRVEYPKYVEGLEAKVELVKTSKTGMVTSMVESLQSDAFGLTPDKLRNLLESRNLMLPKGVLNTIFARMDTDGSGAIDLTEFEEYVKKVKRPSYYEKRMDILKTCLKDVGFWCSIFFTVGSFLFIGLSWWWKENAKAVEDTNGLGSLLFFLGSLGGFKTYVITTKTNYDLLVYSKMTLRNVAISLGKSTIASERLGKTHQFENLSRKELLQSHSKQQDIDKISELKNIDVNEALVKGAKFLFETLDVQDDNAAGIALFGGQSDGKITLPEIYGALLDCDVMLPASLFDIIYQEIDLDGEGSVSLDELTIYIQAIKEPGTAQEEWVAVGRLLVKSIPFWLSLLGVAGGLCFVIAGYFLYWAPYPKFKDCALAGSIFYAVGSCYAIYQYPINVGLYFDQVESVKYKMRASLVSQVREWKIAKNEKAKQFNKNNGSNGEQEQLAMARPEPARASLNKGGVHNETVSEIDENSVEMQDLSTSFS